MSGARPGRHARRLRLGTTFGAALALLLAVLAPAAGAHATATPSAAPAPAPSTTAEQGDVVVRVTRVEPAVLRPGEDLTVTVRLRNTGAAPVAEPRVRLHLDRRSFISRSSLDRWRTADPDDPTGDVVATLDLTEPLAADAAATATITLPASSIGLRRDDTSWGPRGIAVDALDLADPARARLGLARTFMLWFPVSDVTPTRVSTLVPVVGPAVDPYDSAWVADLEELTADDGRLGRVLEATAGHRDVTWVLDPWLVDVAAGTVDGTDDDEPATGDDAGAASGGDAADDAATAEGDVAPDAEADEPSDVRTPDGDVDVERRAFGALSGTTAAEGARAWAERLLDSTVRRDVELLPYLDPDLGALAHADDAERLETARAMAEDVVARTRLPDGTRASLGWPASARPDVVTADFATRSGERAVVVGPGEMPAPASLTYTPSGRATVSTERGDVVVLVPDARLSAALRTGTPLVDDDGERSGPAPTPAVAAQDLLAELAVITRERPSDSRHMLLTVPRDWSPDPAVVDAQLTALDEAPWVQHESVSALVGAPGTGVEREGLPRRASDGAELSAAQLTRNADAVAERLRVAEMVPDPAGLVGDTRLELLAPVATAWRADPDGRAAVVEASVASTSALRGSVEVLESSTVNLLATSGGVPVRVGNRLPQEVTVAVSLRPGDSRLRADEPVEVTIAPGAEELVRVPVHAIQSANLRVGAVVTTLDGEPVDDDTVLLVRVRAEWEGIGTAVIAALLAVGMVLGLVRSIRRARRTGRRARPVTDHGPDALSPEAHAETADAPGARPPGGS